MFDKMKMFFLKLTESELKVVEYTDANIAWGPTTDQMDDLVNRCKNAQDRREILAKLFQLMTQEKIQWKTVYKCLLTIEHMTYYADFECITYFRNNAKVIERLKDNYRFRDDEGCDKGINVRKRAEQVYELITDEHLDEKRNEAQKALIKYAQHAVSNDTLNQFQNPNYNQQQQQKQQVQQVQSNNTQQTISQQQTPQQQVPQIQQKPQLPVFKQTQPAQVTKPSIPQMKAQPVVAPLQQQIVQEQPKPEPQIEQPVQQVQQQEKKDDLLDDLFGLTDSNPQPVQNQQDPFGTQQQNQQIDLFGQPQQPQQQQVPVQQQSNDIFGDLLDF